MEFDDDILWVRASDQWVLPGGGPADFKLPHKAPHASLLPPPAPDCGADACLPACLQAVQAWTDGLVAILASEPGLEGLFLLFTGAQMSRVARAGQAGWGGRLGSCMRGCDVAMERRCARNNTQGRDFAVTRGTAAAGMRRHHLALNVLGCQLTVVASPLLPPQQTTSPRWSPRHCWPTTPSSAAAWRTPAGAGRARRLLSWPPTSIRLVCMISSGLWRVLRREGAAPCPLLLRCRLRRCSTACCALTPTPGFCTILPQDNEIRVGHGRGDGHAGAAQGAGASRQSAVVPLLLTTAVEGL